MKMSLVRKRREVLKLGNRLPKHNIHKHSNKHKNEGLLLPSDCLNFKRKER